eukprot:scaffold13927_cov32-Tisochrysis_lutea.AAC.1
MPQRRQEGLGRGGQPASWWRGQASQRSCHPDDELPERRARSPVETRQEEADFARTGTDAPGDDPRAAAALAFVIVVL